MHYSSEIYFCGICGREMSLESRIEGGLQVVIFCRNPDCAEYEKEYSPALTATTLKAVDE